MKKVLVFKITDFDYSDIIKYYPVIYKATRKEVKTVRGKGGKVHRQTYHVGKKVESKNLQLSNMSNEEILKLQSQMNSNSSALQAVAQRKFHNLTDGLLRKVYNDTNLSRFYTEYLDAYGILSMKAFTALKEWKPEGKEGKGGAKLSSLVFSWAKKGAINEYKKLKNKADKEVVDNYDQIENMATVTSGVDHDLKLQIDEVTVKLKKEMDRRIVSDAGDDIAFNEREGEAAKKLYDLWMEGYSFREMGKKLGVSRQMINRKFKAYIYPVVESIGYKREEINKHFKDNRKFNPHLFPEFKKSIANEPIAGWLIIKTMMERHLGIKPEYNIAGIVSSSNKKKFEYLKEFYDNNNESTLKYFYLVLNNPENFTPQFLNFMSHSNIKLVNNGKPVNMEHDRIEINRKYRNLEAVQHLVLASLIVEYFKKEIHYICDDYIDFSNFNETGIFKKLFKSDVGVYGDLAITVVRRFINELGGGYKSDFCDKIKSMIDVDIEDGLIAKQVLDL